MSVMAMLKWASQMSMLLFNGHAIVKGRRHAQEVTITRNSTLGVGFAWIPMNSSGIVGFILWCQSFELFGGIGRNGYSLLNGPKPQNNLIFCHVFLWCWRARTTAFLFPLVTAWRETLANHWKLHPWKKSRDVEQLLMGIIVVWWGTTV